MVQILVRISPRIGQSVVADLNERVGVIAIYGPIYRHVGLNRVNIADGLCDVRLVNRSYQGWNSNRSDCRNDCANDKQLDQTKAVSFVLLSFVPAVVS